MNEIEARNHLALGAALAAYRSNARVQPRQILLLSPSVRDVSFLRTQFPSARFYVATVGSWDLNEPFPLCANVA